MNKLLLAFTAISSSLFAHSPCEEEEVVEKSFPYWEHQLLGKFDINKSQFSNWQSGGEDALTWQLIFDGSSNHKTETGTWENNLKLAYGRTKLGDKGSRKSLDEIKSTTRYTYNMSEYLNPYSSVTFASQITAGYEYPETEDGTPLDRIFVSDFMSPGYLTESVGLGSEPVKKLVIRLGGALKQTFSDKEFLYADDTDTENKIETFKNEPGLEFSLDYEYAFNKILLYKTRFYSFTNFEGHKEIDASFENHISAQIAEWVNISLGYDLLYDRDLDTDYQSKSLLSLGLHYSFI